RNEGVRPRVAVRLKGAPANTRGIGAKIWVYGGAVPMQSQEMISGGRYLSCDDAMRVFAAGSLTNEMRLEVRWRSGKRSVVEAVRANRIYEVEEAGAAEATGTSERRSVGTPERQSVTLEKAEDASRLTDHESRLTNSPPVFEDVSRLIQHL